MTITNKHLGWGILLLILLYPVYYCAIHLGLKHWWHGELTAWGTINALIFLIELVAAGLSTIIGIVVLIAKLLTDDINFEWEIELPRKKKPVINRDDFLKLGKLDQDSPEWKEIYNKLDKKGQWG